GLLKILPLISDDLLSTSAGFQEAVCYCEIVSILLASKRCIAVVLNFLSGGPLRGSSIGRPWKIFHYTRRGESLPPDLREPGAESSGTERHPAFQSPRRRG